MATAQDTAVGLANQVLQAGQRLEALLQDVNGVVSQYTDIGASTLWGGLPTAAKTTSGNLGTADASPTSGHPIDTRVVTALSQAVAATSLSSIVGFLQDFQAFMNGTAVTTANRRQAMNQDLTS